jgi:predicted nucleic acid-binding Zn ribbon protein
MNGTVFLLLAALSAVASVAVLRVSWAGKRRSVPLNLLGWGLIALAAVLGWLGAGAWGASVAAIFGMGAAGIALAVAAATSPEGKAAASNRRVKMLPESGERKRIAGRLLTFGIVAPLAMLVSLGLAVAVRGLLDWFGASEANSIVLGFFTAPIAWGTLAHLLLIQQRRRTQWLILLIGALPVVPVVLTGVLQ